MLAVAGLLGSRVVAPALVTPAPRGMDRSRTRCRPLPRSEDVAGWFGSRVVVLPPVMRASAMTWLAAATALFASVMALLTRMMAASPSAMSCSRRVRLSCPWVLSASHTARSTTPLKLREQILAPSAVVTSTPRAMTPGLAIARLGSVARYVAVASPLTGLMVTRSPTSTPGAVL